MRRLLTTLAAAAVLTTTPATAQTLLDEGVCGKREEVTGRLEAKFGEFQKGAGVVSNNRVLELWQSKKTGSWTVLMTRTDGRTCIIAAGNHWRDQKLTEGDPT